ncbi:hypothetical protein NDU88_005713 [Pleurodeles waltl]|uniref:Uncharacterized protein n=1 Tax=Pleurodeles waltl TaxID=8319 RepID=A0AAV7TDE7_PLEWA|nr:hypothetical protein NDU88_005713 [Pleurodeles waltl]
MSARGVLVGIVGKAPLQPSAVDPENKEKSKYQRPGDYVRVGSSFGGCRRGGVLIGIVGMAQLQPSAVDPENKERGKY